MPLIRPHRYVNEVASARFMQSVLTVITLETEFNDDVTDYRAAFALLLSDNWTGAN